MTGVPRKTWRLAVVGVVAALGLATTTVATAVPRADVIPLPPGFSPEGIATGAGSSLYVGSLRDGDIWRGSLRTGVGDVLVDAPAGRVAVGLKVDAFRHRVVVAGGATGKAFVYDSRTGAPVAERQLADSSSTFMNDVTLTPWGAWFTDSAQPVLYFVPFGPGGTSGSPRTLAFSGPAADTSGEFNLNGIAAAFFGRTLLVAHSGRSEILAVDPKTGESATVDLGGVSMPNADGLLLAGKQLWVVQNFLNQVTELRLSSDYTSGRVVQVKSDPRFRIPTTIARKGNTLAVVNARFDLGIPGPETAEYEVVLLPR